MGEYEPHDSRKVAQQRPGRDEGKRPGWRQAEAGRPHDEAYEPVDSRHVTQGQEVAPGAPGEGAWRRQEAAEAALGATELDGDERGQEAEQVADAPFDAQAEQALREAAMEEDAEELDAAEDAARTDRND